MLTNLRLFILRQLTKIYYRVKFKVRFIYNDFDRKRKDPYFLVGNHSFMHDGVIHVINMKKYPFPIINAFMFINEKMKFLLTKIIFSIPKRKGQVDITMMRQMLKTIKQGRGIMVFPEGNASCFGKESSVPFSTVKMFKKFKLDVVFAKTRGAYLSSPRWGEKATRRGLIEIEFKTLFKANELDRYTEEEMYEKLVEEIKFNDWDWNREKQHLYNPKKRALGLENYIYYCPECHQHQTIYTKGNNVYCEHCGEIAHFNAYSLISGLPFDNLVDWNQLQKDALPEIMKQIIVTSGTMELVDMTKYETTKLGPVDIEINPKSRSFFTQNRDQEKIFDVDIIKGLTLTMKREISFDYKKKTYLFRVKDPMLVYDALNYLKGE